MPWFNEWSRSFAPMDWAKNRRAAMEYERVKQVVEEILAEKYAPPLHLQPSGAKREEAAEKPAPPQ